MYNAALVQRSTGRQRKSRLRYQEITLFGVLYLSCKSFKNQNVIYATFQVADAVMLALALGMLKGLKNLKEMEAGESVPFAVTVVMTVFTQNIAYGAAAGCVISIFMVLAGLRKKEICLVPVSQYVMSVLAIVLMVISMAAPTLGGSSAASGGTDSENGGAVEQTETM